MSHRRGAAKPAVKVVGTDILQRSTFRRNLSPTTNITDAKKFFLDEKTFFSSRKIFFAKDI